MTPTTRLIAAAALTALTAPAFAQALPAAVGKPLQAATAAARNHNDGAAQAALNQARANAHTPEERRKVGQVAAYVYVQTGQYGKAAAELQSAGASPAELAPLYYQAREWDNAIAAAKRAGGPKMQNLIAQAYLQSNRAGAAAQTYEQLLKSDPGNQRYLENLAGAQFKMGNKAAYLATTTRLVRANPTPERWRTLLANMEQTPLSTDAKLALYSLMRETNSLKDAREVQDFAKLAIVANQPGTAVGVLQDALKSGVLPQTDDSNRKLLQAAQQRAQAAAPAAGRMAQVPGTSYQGASQLLGDGQYPAAVAGYDRAIQAGNQDDAARVFKGVALIRSGQAKAARGVFDSVPDKSGMKDVANLWALYASTKA